MMHLENNEPIYIDSGNMQECAGQQDFSPICKRNQEAKLHKSHPILGMGFLKGLRSLLQSHCAMGSSESLLEVWGCQKVCTVKWL